jgi:L-threonylcarbamoyladenylate synthase
MDTKIVNIDKLQIDEDIINEAAKIINSGGVVAFPTETVYGLGANGLDENAVKKIYIAKERPQDNPLILHVSSKEEVIPLVKDISEVAYSCMDKFWPGPLTLIFNRSEIVPDIITGGLDSVAIRMPNNEIALKLIKESGTPIAAPSANTSGSPSPTRANHVIEDLNGKIDMIIDGGSTEVGLESTILDLTGQVPSILRPGGITMEQLRELIPNVIVDVTESSEFETPKSPGQKYRHYSPVAELIIFEGEVNNISKAINKKAIELMADGQKVGIMATEETKEEYPEGYVIVVGSREKRETIASNLFTAIRLFDKAQIDTILAEGIEMDNIGIAIMNRLVKAASGKVIKV